MLLGATLRASQALELPLISMSMGALGALSRITGFAFGSALTFGVGAGSSAPGQMPIGELRNGDRDHAQGARWLSPSSAA